MGICKQYIQHTALPNVIGNENMRTVLTDYQWFKSYEALTDMIGLCHQHLEELACHVHVPKCDPVSRQVIHPVSYENYSVLDTFNYSCSEGFQMVGNKKISCMYSGEWSTPPPSVLFIQYPELH